MRRVVVIPVKAPAQAKSRLRAVLDDDAREDLARRMARRSIRAALDAPRVDDVLVVSRDPLVLAEAAAEGATPVDERELVDAGDSARALNGALELARRRALEIGVVRLAVVMADLPRIEATDVDALFAALEREAVAVVLAPDADGPGLGALALDPAGCLAFAFGGGRALERHREAAVARSLAVAELRRPGLAFDLDTAEHLAAAGPIDRIPEPRG